jgi:serine protease inhibitor
MRRLPKLLPLLLICILFTRCGDNTVCPDGQPRPLTAGEANLVNAFNAFGFNLFKEVAADEGSDKNVFVSPLSVSMALGMALNGAAGTTEEAMKTALEFSGLTMEEIDESYQSLMELLCGLDPDVQFEIANSIWYNEPLGIEIQQSFFDVCLEYFDAGVTSLDFQSPEAAPTINGWVASKTHDKITEIVDAPIDPLMVMFLVNAIYFLGSWTHQFDPWLTYDGGFTIPAGSTVMCRMMQQPAPDETAMFEAFQDETVQIVDLPYADGWYSMMIVLPRPAVDIDTLVAGLDEARWDGWASELKQIEGRLKMPKFEIECEYRLDNMLKALGMAIAFDCDDADFTRMLVNPAVDLFISEVKHKTYVRVDEEGTEAAAVTSVGMGTTSAPEFINMIVDRPFLFAIKENHSGTIVFMGKVADPS